MLAALEDAMIYLKRDGEIAIIDGANTTIHRRELIRRRVLEEVSSLYSCTYHRLGWIRYSLD